MSTEVGKNVTTYFVHPLLEMTGQIHWGDNRSVIRIPSTSSQIYYYLIMLLAVPIVGNWSMEDQLSSASRKIF